MLNEIALTSIKRKLFCCYLFIIMSYLIRKPWIAAGKMSPQRFDYLEMHYNNCIVWLYKYVFIKNTFPWNYIMAGYCIKENPQLLQPLVFVHYAQKLLLSAEERLIPFGCELCMISKTEVCSHQFIFIISYFYGFPP